jgi:aryl carrier-like protein
MREVDAGEPEADHLRSSSPEQLWDLQRRHAVTSAGHASLQERQRELLERLWEREQELADLPALEEAGLDSARLEAELRLIYGSRSWRYTRSCRWAGRLVRSMWAVARR